MSQVCSKQFCGNSEVYVHVCTFSDLESEATVAGSEEKRKIIILSTAIRPDFHPKSHQDQMHMIPVQTLALRSDRYCDLREEEKKKKKKKLRTKNEKEKND